MVDFGYANVLGVSEDLGLEGNQYSLLNIILSSAQLAWQPISSYILVRVPPRILMTVLVVCWGAIQTGMAGGTTYVQFLSDFFPFFATLPPRPHRDCSDLLDSRQ